MKNSTNNSGLSQFVTGFEKSPVAIRNLLDGTYASKTFDFVFLHGKPQEFESSKNQLRKINNEFTKELLESSKKDQEQYKERKTNYLLRFDSEEREVAGQVYDELYQNRLKKMLRDECKEYEEKAKKFATRVEQNLEKANKESEPSCPDMIITGVLMMTPFGIFGVFDYFDQIQQIYEFSKPAIDGLQNALKEAPFIGDLIKELYLILDSEVGSSATAFAGSLSNDFLLKSAISYFAAKRMAVKLIDSYDDKKQNFDSAIEKVEKFNSALTNNFKRDKSKITDEVEEYLNGNSEAFKGEVEVKKNSIEARKKDVSSFNERFFTPDADKDLAIRQLLKFDPATANDEEKKAFIEKAWIVFFAEKDSDIASSRGNTKSASKSGEKNSDDNYFKQLSNFQELEFAKKFSEIGFSNFEKDEELKSSIKDLRLIQGKAMLISGLQHDSTEFLSHLLPNQNIETLTSEDFQVTTLEDGKIYTTQLEKLDPKYLDEMSALILYNGNGVSGHYTALIKQKIVESGEEKSVWFYYDDDKVTEIKNNKINSILQTLTIRAIVNVNSSDLPIATKDENGVIKPAFRGLKNTGNSCFANAAVALINSLPNNAAVKKEFINNLDKVGVAPDLEGKSKLSILELQNQFIAAISAQKVVAEIDTTNAGAATKQTNQAQRPTEQKTSKVLLSSVTRGSGPLR